MSLKRPLKKGHIKPEINSETRGLMTNKKSRNMQLNKLLLLSCILFCFIHNKTKGQGASCGSADPFCTGTTYTFPATTGVANSGTFACLATTPNPAWYYLQVANTGDIVVNISQTDANGNGADVDFICYGPYTSQAAACSNQTGDCINSGTNPLSNNAGCNGNVVDCSYSSSANETCGIQGAVAGQWYMLMLTNYSNVAGNITFGQGNSGSGSGTTNCNILCNISDLTAIAGSCSPTTNTFDVTGVVTYAHEPTTGTLTITNTCTSATQVFNAPFNAGSESYTLTGLPANGAACIVKAIFSGDTLCKFIQNFTSPPTCVTCSVVAANNGPLCPGQSLNLTATPTAGATYSWTGPNGFSFSSQNPVITNVIPSMTGTYYVSVNVASPLCNTSDSTVVVINSAPLITVTSPSTCAGLPTTVQASGATSYIWSTGETTSGISVTGASATYTVVGTSNGCKDTAISTVTTYAHPVVNFTADKLSGCNPILVHFSADTSGLSGASFTWDFGDGTTGSGFTPSHDYSLNGCHTVTVTINLSSSCFSTDSIPCMIKVFPQPEASFIITPDEIDILAPTAYFNNSSMSSTIWLWDFGDNTSSFVENPSHTYNEIGTYPVTLYASNLDGCIDSSSFSVIINDYLSLYIPNSFSPNRDGINDFFYVYSHGVSTENFELLIFDRWGNSVFKTNDLYDGWNGTINNHDNLGLTGNIVEMDVYVYRVNYRDFKGKKRSATGQISLIR